MPEKLIPALMPRFGFRAQTFFTGKFCGTNDFPAQPGIGHLHLVRSGRLLIEHADGTRLRVDQPACVLYPHAVAHRLTVPEGVETELICTTLHFKEAAANPFVLALPDVMTVPLSEMAGIDHVVGMLSEESAGSALGRDFVLDRLCEILVCQLVRHASATGQLKFSVLAAFADSGIGRALAAIHAEPACDWRVERLAELASMSRSAFARRFHDLVGQTPANYVTEFRLQLARTLLLRRQPVKVVAGAVGYQTQQSFTRAFVARHGMPPTQWLIQQLEQPG